LFRGVHTSQGATKRVGCQDRELSIFLAFINLHKEVKKSLIFPFMDIMDILPGLAVISSSGKMPDLVCISSPGLCGEGHFMCLQTEEARPWGELKGMIRGKK